MNGAEEPQSTPKFNHDFRCHYAGDGLTQGSDEQAFCRSAIEGNSALEALAYQRNRISENVEWYKKGGDFSEFVANLKDPTLDVDLQWWLDFASNGTPTTLSQDGVNGQGALAAYSAIKAADPTTASAINQDFLGTPAAIQLKVNGKTEDQWSGPQAWLYDTIPKSWGGGAQSGLHAIKTKAATLNIAPDTSKGDNTYTPPVVNQDGGDNSTPPAPAANSWDSFVQSITADGESLMWLGGGLAVLVLGFYLIA